MENLFKLYFPLLKTSKSTKKLTKFLTNKKNVKTITLILSLELKNMLEVRNKLFKLQNYENI